MTLQHSERACVCVAARGEGGRVLVFARAWLDSGRAERRQGRGRWLGSWQGRMTGCRVVKAERRNRLTGLICDCTQREEGRGGVEGGGAVGNKTFDAQKIMADSRRPTSFSSSSLSFTACSFQLCPFVPNPTISLLWKNTFWICDFGALTRAWLLVVLQVSVSLSANESMPGDPVTLHVRGDKGSCVCVATVDKSLYLLKPDFQLSPEKVWIKMF